MKTLAQVFNAELPFTIYDEGGNVIYREEETRWWSWEYLDGNHVTPVYFENSNGYWMKMEYVDGREVYYENSNGKVEDKR